MRRKGPAAPGVVDFPAAAMKPASRLQRLLAAVRAACPPGEGRRAALAAQLGWREQALSSFLAERPTRLPGAEKALQLAEWLDAQAAPPVAAAKPAASSSFPHPARRVRYRAPHPQSKTGALAALRDLINSDA